MTEKQRNQLIDAISTLLQEEYVTADINSFLRKFKFPFEKRTVTNNKKNYVIEAIDNQSEEVLIKMAEKLELHS